LSDNKHAEKNASDFAVKTFISAALVLVVMLIVTGLLTYVIPNGTFNSETMTFTENATRGIDFVNWFGAPVLVLFSDSGVLVIAIILFLLIIGGALHVLKQAGLIEGVIFWVAERFAKSPKKLLAALTLFFMALGAFVGVFEEVVPLVPMVILLSRRMGWDDLTGLGISVLACGVGFAAAVTNPFTIGIAQELASLPMFSGALLRLGVFASVYAVLLFFLNRRISKQTVENPKNGTADLSALAEKTVDEMPEELPQAAYRFFAGAMAVMVLLVALIPFVSALRDLSLPLIALIFLVAGIGSGRIVKGSFGWVFKQFAIGARDMSPAILLVLLATGIKHVMTEGHILDTILYAIAVNLDHFSPFVALILAFFAVMLLNFFIGSGSAKAFILMPILIPIMDLLGVGRQLGILAFQFGDGFSNVLYPTNAVLLIALSLSQVSYVKWFKFVLPFQMALFVLSLVWLGIGFSLGYGL